MAPKATTTNAMNDGVSVRNEPAPKKDAATTVRVFLPLLDDTVSGDTKVDQTETVVINGVATQIRRGEYVDVKVPVYLQLRNKFPKLNL